MSEATIREAIYQAVRGVSQVGIVHDYERQVTNWDDFLELFTTPIGDATQVRGWMIGYRGMPTTNRLTFNMLSNAGTERIHRFRLIGVMGISDADESEKTFAALAEDVCDTLDADTTLHTARLDASPATLLFDARPFANVLVHGAIINIEVTEMV